MGGLTTLNLGLVFCACRDDHISIKLRKCGILPVCMALCLIASLILPYISMVAKKVLPAFLPLVSDTGGSPPSSGVFAICLILASFFGFITFPILYFNIKHRNVNDSKYIRLANKLLMLFSSISCLGLTITGAFPVGYTDIPNMFEWFTAVLWEHCLGAIMIFGGAFVFQLLVTIMWWYLPGTSRRAAYIRIPFICIYILLFFIAAYPLPNMLLELLGQNPFDFARMKNRVYDIPREYSVNYLICSFCEYSLCAMSALFIGMFYKDMQNVSLRIVLRHKSCVTEFEEPAPSIKLKNIS
ncbi:hypothetical protein TNCT_207911 [Trichonephila clavata]|uniref:CWH43-like N-terminal domain-containing protein n=1 Tax=Trichonephila clavata TaxID=2740835 RepID=A0A8X6LH49_TRICU|nr:hypothetical protein TNCT_207911 [Trichonephila clavata]